MEYFSAKPKACDTVVIDEAHPERVAIPIYATGVSFDNRFFEPVPESALREALARQSARDQITAVAIRRNSQLHSAWPVEYFPNLKAAGMSGRNLADISQLAILPRLERLRNDIAKPPKGLLAVLPSLHLKRLEAYAPHACDYQFLDASPPLEFLRVSGWSLLEFSAPNLRVGEIWFENSRLGTAAGITRDGLHSVAFRGCRRLRSVTGLRVEALTIEECSKLEVATVGSVQGLKRLIFRSQPPITSLEFLRSLPELEELSFAATRVQADDLSPLSEAPALLFIYSVTEKQLETVAKNNPRLAASNGEVHYVAGAAVDRERYWDVVEGMRAAAYTNANS